MMLAAVETVTKADPVWESRRHNSDVAAQATARESFHAASPLKSSGRNVYNEQHCHCNCPLRAGTFENAYTLPVTLRHLTAPAIYALIIPLVLLVVWGIV
jgi:hypothetical protein